MPRGRLLVADRNLEFLGKTNDVLRAAGYDVVQAHDGRRVLELVVSKARPVDGLILHFALDGIDGIEVCRQLRDRDETLPCYLMIPHDDDELVAQCLEAGARNVLVRPLKRTELLFAARSLMNLRSLLRAARGGGDGSAAMVSRRAPPPPPHGKNADERASFFQFELFKRLLAIELKRSKRYDFPLSLLLVAPDGEPILSLAAGGHVEGFDADASQIVARAVQQAIRDIDIPMHFADDILMVVMPHTDADGAHLVAERIRRKARSGEGAITVSIGVTSMTGAAKPTYAQLVARAKLALRAARKAGGDSVRVG